MQVGSLIHLVSLAKWLIETNWELIFGLIHHYKLCLMFPEGLFSIPPCNCVLHSLTPGPGLSNPNLEQCTYTRTQALIPSLRNKLVLTLSLNVSNGWIDPGKMIGYSCPGHPDTQMYQLGNLPHTHPAISLLTKVAQGILSTMPFTRRVAGWTSYTPRGWGFQGSEEAVCVHSARQC